MNMKSHKTFPGDIQNLVEDVSKLVNYDNPVRIWLDDRCHCFCGIETIPHVFFRQRPIGHLVPFALISLAFLARIGMHFSTRQQFRHPSKQSIIEFCEFLKCQRWIRGNPQFWDE